MRSDKNVKGQTLIETAFILILLLMIVLGIAEFARAWFMKSSLKNAVRQGVRVAVVTQPANITISFQCDSSTACPNSGAIINAVCCQPGVPKKGTGTGIDTTSVTVTCSGSTTDCSVIQPSDTIKVQAGTTFKAVVGSSFFPWLQNISIPADASMRYE